MFHKSKILGRLTLFRHAECEHNLKKCCAGFFNGTQPTEEGLNKTRMVGRLLAKNNIKFDTLYVSPLDRALRTAKALLEVMPPITMVIDESLAERNFGAFLGLSKDEIREQLSPEDYYKYINDKNFFPPDINPGHKYYKSSAIYGVWPYNHKGESYQCVMNRQAKLIKQIQKQILEGVDVAILSHSHALCLFLIKLYGVEFEKGRSQFKISHNTPIELRFGLNASNDLVIVDTINLLETLMDLEHKTSLLQRSW